jgi:DNA-damage-inducible protein D
MRSKSTPLTGIWGVLSDPRVLRKQHDGEDWYSAIGIVQVLTESEHPEEYWGDLKLREPVLAARVEPVEFILNEEGSTITTDALDLDGVLRLIQSIDSPRAERLKRWLVESARQRLEEAEDPELALLRTRRLYEQHGYSPRWIDKRLRGISARQELTAEWHARGVSESEQFRELTNTLVKSAMGMDVETYRRYKGLLGKSENLRDHMSDLELALTTLAETTAAVLHRDRSSEGLPRLLADVTDAGEIVAATAAQIERRSGKPVVEDKGKRDKEKGKSVETAA